MSDLSKICLLTCVVSLCFVTPPVDAQNTAKPATPDSVNTDVCKLLTSAEIEAVQSERVEQTKPNTRASGGLLISDCLFRTTTASKSVSLELVMRDPKANSALTPQEYWRKQFGAAGAEKEAKTSEAREDRDAPEARHIAGIGQEAYWVGTPIAGALYVLQGERFIRISIGGVRDEKTRIERSKSLALAALKRL